MNMRRELDLCLDIEPWEPLEYEAIHSTQKEFIGSKEKLTTKNPESKVGGCKDRKQTMSEMVVVPPPVETYTIIKGDWTCATLHPIMEYLYTEKCHVPCEDVWQLWVAANDILLTSLTELIVQHPIVEYLRLALKTEANRRSLLKLTIVADSILNSS
jgi:hypothetical protein